MGEVPLELYPGPDTSRSTLARRLDCPALGRARAVVCECSRQCKISVSHRYLPQRAAPSPSTPTPGPRELLAGSASILCTGGLHVIRKEAWPLYRTISCVRLCWELEEPKGPKGSKQHRAEREWSCANTVHVPLGLVGLALQVHSAQSRGTGVPRSQEPPPPP